jgi:hypothetical protein
MIYGWAGVVVQSSSSPMRIIIGADGFQLRSSFADGREPLNEAGRHVRATCVVVSKVLPPLTTRSALHRPGAVLGRAASDWASPRTLWRRGPGPREPKPSCRRTGGQILPAESPHWPSRGGKGNSPQPWRATIGGVFGFLSGSTNAASRVTPFRPGALTLDVNTGCQKNREQRQECSHRGIALC